MKAIYRLMLPLVLLLAAEAAFAGGSKGKNVKISFHMETHAADNPKMIFPHALRGEEKYFRRIPEVTTKDIAAFSPFPSDDQASYGVVLELKKIPSGRILTATQSNSGKWLACQAFGRVIDAVLIEEAIADGKLVIWSGLTMEEIRLMDEAMPRIGETKENKKKKK
jgi:hypothetical protein